MNHTVSSKRWFYGIACVVLGTILFAAKGIVIKLAYAEGITASPLLMLRMVFALPFYLAIAIWVNLKQPTPLTRMQHLKIVGLGVLSYGVSSLFDFMGLQHISAGLERVILYVYPTLVLLMLAFWKKQLITVRDRMALGIAYAGMLLVFAQDIRLSSDWHTTLLGTLYVLIATVTFALFVVLAGDTIPKVGATRFTAYAMLSACSGVIVFCLLKDGTGAVQQTQQVYLLTMVLAFFCTVIPSFLMNRGIAIVGSGKTAMMGSFGPVITLFLGAWLLQEELTLNQLVGAGLVIGGVTLTGRQNS
ncbi:MAG: DMT family transporter [Pseudomonadota bacterium]